MPRPRFGLRALLALVSVLSVCFALIAWRPLLGSVLAVILVAALTAGYGLARRQRGYVMLGAGVAIAAACMLACDMIAQILYVGHVTLVFTVNVVDAESGAAIPGASVHVHKGEEFRPPWTREVTDRRGIASFHESVMYAGRESSLGISTERNAPEAPLGYYTLSVEADGYEPASLKLSQALGRRTWPVAVAHLPELMVKLKSSGGGAQSLATE